MQKNKGGLLVVAVAAFAIGNHATSPDNAAAFGTIITSGVVTALFLLPVVILYRLFNSKG